MDCVYEEGADFTQLLMTVYTEPAHLLPLLLVTFRLAFVPVHQELQLRDVSSLERADVE